MPDCKDLTDIDQNPPCNEKELACPKPRLPTIAAVESPNRSACDLRARDSYSCLRMVSTFPWTGFDGSINRPAFNMLISSQILIESTIPWMRSDASGVSGAFCTIDKGKGIVFRWRVHWCVAGQ